MSIIDRNNLKIRYSQKISTLYFLFHLTLYIFSVEAKSIDLDRFLPKINGANPTAIALSDDSRKIAIATDIGNLAVINPFTEKLLWKTRISKGYIKHLTFNPSGNLLYIGENSNDGFIYCYDLIDKKLLWRYRLADDLETSFPHRNAGAYAWVQYPGVARIKILENGDLLVAGVHSWRADGKQKIRSQLYRFDRNGKIIWKFTEKTFPLIIRWFSVDAKNKTIALICDTLSADQTPKNSASNMLLRIDSKTGEILWRHTFEPLSPHFDRVTFWRGLALSPDGKSIGVTTDDGRAFIFENDKLIWKKNLTTPIEVSGIPIIATAGTIAATSEVLLLATGDTFIPHNSINTNSDRSLLSVHPNGMMLIAHSWNGKKLWQWKLQNFPQGLQVQNSKERAIIATSNYDKDRNKNPNGISIFDLKTSTDLLDRQIYSYRIQGRIPYELLAVNKGSVAVVEMPIVDNDGGSERGKSRLHVISEKGP